MGRTYVQCIQQDVPQTGYNFGRQCKHWHLLLEGGGGGVFSVQPAVIASPATQGPPRAMLNGSCVVRCSEKDCMTFFSRDQRRESYFWTLNAAAWAALQFSPVELRHFVRLQQNKWGIGSYLRVLNVFLATFSIGKGCFLSAKSAIWMTFMF